MGQGHTVISRTSPDDLNDLDCFVGKFSNTYTNEQNDALATFLTEGGGLVFGGQRTSDKSNADALHIYSGNKIAATTGLFVSTNTGLPTGSTLSSNLV